MREVEAPTLPRQSAERWRQGCQFYAPAALYSPEIFLVLICVRGREAQDHSTVGRMRSVQKSNDIGIGPVMCLIYCQQLSAAINF